MIVSQEHLGFGYSHSVDYGFDDGQWTELENGDRI